MDWVKRKFEPNSQIEFEREHTTLLTMPPKVTKVDLKKSMTSHQTWVNDAVGWAEKFIGDNPDGLTSPWDVTIAKELIGKIKENFPI